MATSCPKGVPPPLLASTQAEPNVKPMLPAMQATPLQETTERQDTDQYVEPALRVSRMETRSLAAEAESAEVCPRWFGTCVSSLMPWNPKGYCAGS